jgi:hypothetical protein
MPLHTRSLPCMYASALLLTSLAAGCSGGDIVPITNYNWFCEAVLTPPDPDAFSSKARYFAPEAIRKDFIRTYDSLVSTFVAAEFLGDAGLNDRVVTELRRLQMVGSWRHGTHLHVANSLLHPPEAGTPAEVTFDGWVDGYHRYVDIEHPPEMNVVQKCLFRAMNAFFDSLTVHGPENSVATMPLAHYMKSHEKYNALVTGSR